MKKQFEVIDTLAEVDSALFWHHINSRRKKYVSTSGYNINFNGRNLYSEREITDEWARYFSNLYKLSENPAFDEPLKNTVCDTVRRLNQDANESVNGAISISSEEIESALKLDYKGKACGDDGIFYEHIFFAGVELFKMLSNYFLR